MNCLPIFRDAWVALALITALTPPLAAQNALYAEYDGKPCLVVRVRDNRAYVNAGDKLAAVNAWRFALVKVEEYLPVFVAVGNLGAQTSYVDMNAAQINNDFYFHASLESPYSLEDVFIVLELNTETAGQTLFFQEVGQLKARESKWISIRVPLANGLGAGQYRFHLFSKGMEVLQSEIPALQREEALDRMIAKRLPPGPDAAPKLFVGPAPEYPRAFLKTKTKGRAVVALRIGANGRVYDPTVKSATDPALGQAALKAVRLWRFLPLMKDGRPVETQVEIPIEFAPPAQPAGKS